MIVHGKIEKARTTNGKRAIYAVKKGVLADIKKL
jgi:hypothetical protein